MYKNIRCRENVYVYRDSRDQFCNNLSSSHRRIVITNTLYANIVGFTNIQYTNYNVLIYIYILYSFS